jgi:hypothetical protein
MDKGGLEEEGTALVRDSKSTKRYALGYENWKSRLVTLATSRNVI